MDKTKDLAFKIEQHAVLTSVRVPSPPEMALAKGRLLSDVVVIKHPGSFAIGHFLVHADKRLKIGMKFKVTICFQQVSEEDYMSIVTDGLMKVCGGKNKDVGVV